MAAENKKDKSKWPTVKVNLEVKVDPAWIKLCVAHPDMFGFDYIGHWGRGIQIIANGKKSVGWLVWEFEEDEQLSALMAREGVSFLNQLDDEELDKLHQPALEAYAAGKPLPKYYHALDEDGAKRAWVEGVKRYGEDWYERPQTDANTYDAVLQLALLGEIKYG